MKDLLQKYILETITVLNDTHVKLEHSEIKSILIDATYFNAEFMHEINISEHITILKELKSIKMPVLYWFEFTASGNNQAIRQKFEMYREPLKRDFANANYRNTSSFKKHIDMQSKTLYVGKVETGFWGRVVTHLGYNQSIKTAGMQLHHWCNLPLFGDLKLNYIVFDPSMKHLIALLEKRLANDLRPLIGRY